MLQRITSKELTELRVFYSLEPFGSEREDWRQAIAGAAVVHSLGGNVKAEHLIPRCEEEAEQTPEEMLAQLTSTLGNLLPVTQPNTDASDYGDYL